MTSRYSSAPNPVGLTPQQQSWVALGGLAIVAILVLKGVL